MRQMFLTLVEPRIRDKIFLAALILFAAYFALSGLLVRPALWFDEGITLEIARNYALFGHLDVLTAPHVFSNLGYLVGTNGYPLTLPLALVFKIFGYGFLQARIFMFLWLMATLGVMYAVVKKLFGFIPAISSVALSVTFATLYADGLTATGETVALFFFLIGMWFLLAKQEYFYMGIFWGLAMATKPGLYLILVHTTIICILLFDRKGWFKKLFIAGFGFLGPVLLWLYFQFPLTPETFYSILAYVLNPIDIPIISNWVHTLPVETYEGLVVPQNASASANVVSNLKLFLTSSTLLYFLILGIITGVGLYLGRVREVYWRAFGLLAIYGALVLVFFVRGPGWFRYLFGLQILVLMFLAPALEEIFHFVHKKSYGTRIIGYLRSWQVPAFLALLLVFQCLQLFFFSDISHSTRPLEAIVYVQNMMSKDPSATIGIYNIPILAAFTDPERTYHSSSPQDGYAPLGASPLLATTSPDIVITTKIGLLVGDKEKQVLERSYTLVGDANLSAYNVYVKNKP